MILDPQMMKEVAVRYIPTGLKRLREIINANIVNKTQNTLLLKNQNQNGDIISEMSLKLKKHQPSKWIQPYHAFRIKLMSMNPYQSTSSKFNLVLIACD